MRTVGALVFPGFELLNLYGPLEMFGLRSDQFRSRIITDTPGRGARREVGDDALIGWIARAGAKAEITASLCTGAALLARAGLLDGKAATTSKLAFDMVTEYGPKTDWRRRARQVEDRRIFTASGVSAGMDMALAVIRRLIGPEAAAETARWAEYERNPDPDHDPFAAEETT